MVVCSRRTNYFFKYGCQHPRRHFYERLGCKRGEIRSDVEFVIRLIDQKKFKSSYPTDGLQDAGHEAQTFYLLSRYLLNLSCV
jgi:hypothetical protein